LSVVPPDWIAFIVACTYEATIFPPVCAPKTRALPRDLRLVKKIPEQAKFEVLRLNLLAELSGL
jgi:hypothetical protein